ncbi:DNA-binding protein [Corynebacterium striatum]|uniref:hypothetical protein n=1 Tax=Corynebacterium striatum TaxID=43770 RepID=UPI0010273092|nr:hypothetical protein [Corynebacterium striatum]VFB07746.1 DNA-binding protein [Corynebacterium striatum]VFB07804.1 DNA-binding protein [Corynebacterium striatum]
MNVNQWLIELKGEDSMRAASQKSGYAQTTLQRQIDKGVLSPEMVIALCRAYDRSPVTGLIETGYINDYEVQGPDVEIALRQADNEQLLKEIMRRSDPQARYLFGNAGDDNVIGLAPHLTPVSDVDDSMPLSAVADDSPDEDALREEGDWTDPDYIP